MDTYAGQLVVSTEAQQYALGLAERGYKQRHQGEYQAGAAGEKKATTATSYQPQASQQNSSAKLLSRLVVILLLFLLFMGCVVLFYYTIAKTIVRFVVNQINTIRSAGMKTCPYCAEMVRQEAHMCRYCHRDI